VEYSILLDFCEIGLDVRICYNFELTSPEAKVITRWLSKGGISFRAFKFLGKFKLILPLPLPLHITLAIRNSANLRV
jgi:hypothetical protein